MMQGGSATADLFAFVIDHHSRTFPDGEATRTGPGGAFPETEGDTDLSGKFFLSGQVSSVDDPLKAI